MTSSLKRDISVFFLAFILVLAGVSASLAAANPYVSLAGSYSFLEQADAGLLNDVEFKEGFGASLAFGFDFDHEYGNARLEAEAAYRTNDADEAEFLGNQQSADGTVTSQALMLNGYYVFSNPTRVKPFIMGGLGAARFNLHEIEVQGIRVINEDELQLAYQGGAGLGIEINKDLALDFGYRFFRIANEDLRDEGGNTFSFAYKHHSIGIGLRYTF